MKSKYYLLLILMGYCTIIKGQKVTLMPYGFAPPIVLHDSDMAAHISWFIVRDEVDNEISLVYDSVVYIKGDTAKVLLFAMQQFKSILNQKDSAINSLRNIIQSGVSFTNQIHKYYKTTKTNCKWDEWVLSLKKLGYSQGEKHTNNCK